MSSNRTNSYDRKTELKDCMAREGISQRKFAIEHGFEPALLNAYLCGKRPNRRNALRLADAFQVDVRKLYPNFNELRHW